MKVEVNLSKKYFFSILSVILIIGAIIGVYALIDSSKPNPGHNINEVEGIVCNNDEAVTRNASGWGCVKLPSSTIQSSTLIVGNYTGNSNVVPRTINIGTNISRLSLAYYYDWGDSGEEGLKIVSCYWTGPCAGGAWHPPCASEWKCTDGGGFTNVSGGFKILSQNYNRLNVLYRYEALP